MVGSPITRPEGRSVNPAGTWPDQVYGCVPPLARNVVVKKLFTNTLLPAPMSQTPFEQLKNWSLIANGAVVPVPVPVTGTTCGLPGALSV